MYNLQQKRKIVSFVRSRGVDIIPTLCKELKIDEKAIRNWMINPARGIDIVEDFKRFPKETRKDRAARLGISFSQVRLLMLKAGVKTKAKRRCDYIPAFKKDLEEYPISTKRDRCKRLGINQLTVNNLFKDLKLV